MLNRSHFLRYFLFTSLLASAVACNKNQSDDESGVPAVPNPDAEISTWTGHGLPIALSEVSDGKCLNLQRYFETLQTLSPATKARKVATDFKFRTTGASVPRNFLLRMAAGNFEFVDTDLAQLNDFPKVVQTDCKTVTFSADGHRDVYEIVQPKSESEREKFKSSLTLRNDWKGQLTYSWKSPQSMEVKTSSITGDFLCSPDSKGEVTTTVVINWGDTSIFAESLPANTVSSSFLALVAEATGTSMQTLYAGSVTSELRLSHEADPVLIDDEVDPLTPVDVPAGRPLASTKLRALDGAPVLSDLLQCY